MRSMVTDRRLVVNNSRPLGSRHCDDLSAADPDVAFRLVAKFADHRRAYSPLPTTLGLQPLALPAGAMTWSLGWSMSGYHAPG
ncbi:hypothetical protein [Micromonospora sp. IBHARD004]|uniref:hypothetical protein n=1 Tax=Micromonospora sp. IBHARD004 TaxID=3457764 RepID=UPI0040585BD5